MPTKSLNEERELTKNISEEAVSKSCKFKYGAGVIDPIFIDVLEVFHSLTISKKGSIS